MKNVPTNDFYEMMYKGEKVICVIHTLSGKKAIFDNQPNVLKRILQETETRKKSLVPRGKDGVLMFPKSRQGIASSLLATVLYSEYHNIPLEDVRKYRIQHIERGEIEDCRSCNLYSTGDIAMETSAIKFDFSENNKYIKMLLKKQNKEILFENHYDLFRLLATPHFTTPFMNYYRPQARINGLRTTFKTYSPYLSLLAYACYNQNLTVDNHLQRIPEIMAYNQEQNLQIEHLNGDIFDNRRYNLALVEGNLNASKKDIMKHIQNPYICNVVLGNDFKYRMLLGKAEKVEELINSRLIILDTFDDVVTVLKTYKKVYPTLFTNNKSNSNYLFREPIISEALSTMSSSYFIDYKDWLSNFISHSR